MSRVRAWGSGLAIVAYLAVATVWLPSRVLGLMASQSRMMRDIAGLSVWVFAVAAAVWGLRNAQRRGWI